MVLVQKIKSHCINRANGPVFKKPYSLTSWRTFREHIGKKKHLARRLIATRQINPCIPLSGVAYVHTAKTPVQSLCLLEDSMILILTMTMKNVTAFPTAKLPTSCRGN